MNYKIAVVTGTTGGIGIEICKYLLQNGYCVLGSFRSIQKREQLRMSLKKTIGTTADEQLFLWELDLCSFGSTDRFSEQVIAFVQKHNARLDLLINNAGMIAPRFQLTEDRYERSLQVNYLSPRRLTERLLPHLHPSGKVINTVSCTIRVARPEFPGTKTIQAQEKEFNSLKNYSGSKLWLSVYTIQLQKRHPNLLICGADPGIVDTGIITQHRWYDPLADLFFRPFIKRPAAGAIPILRAIEYQKKPLPPEDSPLLFKGSCIKSFHKKIIALAAVIKVL